MDNILNTIVGNMLLFTGVVLFLLSTFTVLIRSIIKTVQKNRIPIFDDKEEPKPVKKPKKEETPKEEKPEQKEEKKPKKKKEKEENAQTLEDLMDADIKERINEEQTKELDELIESNENEDIKDVLEDMKTENSIDPEEVVKTFENNQEAQSIISYQELVDVIKSNDSDFVDDLETTPLATVSNVIEIDEANIVIPQDQEMLEMIEQLEKTSYDEMDNNLSFDISEREADFIAEAYEDIEVLEVDYPEIEKVDIPENGKFQKTDMISPIYGKINLDKEIEYPKVEKFDKKKKKSKKQKKMEELENVETIEPVVEEISLEQTETVDSDIMNSVLPTIEDFRISTLAQQTDYAEKLFVKVDEGIMNSVMPNFNELKDLSHEVSAGLHTTTIIEEIESDAEEIENLSSTLDFSQDEELRKTIQEFREKL